ncbi:MAG TPA: hydrolase, partial [Ruminococcaceae bacterium]|nr:hydrolase [Oscillospiraceae bacterium]
MGYREEFEEIYQSNIKRSGSRELLEWLQKTDFFTAPASTRFHCACLGGLVRHSVSVYRV